MRSLWIAAAAVALAAAPAAVDSWSAADLDAAGARLAGKLTPQKFAGEQLASYGNHSVMVAHRQADGEAELHEKQADIFVVRSGLATLVYGGTVEGGRTTAPGEVRGAGIRGGQRRPLAPGDIVHIPAQTPHQVLVKPGAKFTYVIVKVDAE